MAAIPHSWGQQLDRFRRYLRLLARGHMNAKLQPKLDPSDLVQFTLLEAYEKRAQFQGATDAEMAAWLRRILVRNVADALRTFGQQKRDLGREQSLEQCVQAASSRVECWLPAPEPSASEQAEEHERALRLAEALAQLPEAQRQALVLQYWQGWTLVQIGQHMERTPAAVAGLLKRGLKKLRQELQA